MHDERRDKVDYSRARADRRVEFVEKSRERKGGGGRGEGGEEEAKARRRTFPPSERSPRDN